MIELSTSMVYRMLTMINLFCLIMAMQCHGVGQQAYLDSLLRVLETEKDELELIKTNNRIGHYYQDNSNPKAIEYYQKVLELSEKNDIPIRVGNSHSNMGYSYMIQGDFVNALDHYLQSVRIYEEIGDSLRLTNALVAVARVYSQNDDYEKSEEYHKKAQHLIEEVGDTLSLSGLLGARGILSDQQGKFDEALSFYFRAYELAEAVQSLDYMSFTLSNIGLTYKRQGNYEQALQTFREVLRMYQEAGMPPDAMAAIHNNLGSTYYALKRYPEALESFNLSLDFAKNVNAPTIIMEDYKQLAELYGEEKNYARQVEYLNRYYQLKDSLFSIESKNTIVQLEAEYQIEQKNSELLQQEAELTKQRNQRNIFLIVSSSALILLLTLAFFYRRIRKTNVLLEDKNTLIRQQNDDLGQALQELKATQALLIHAEKMASLGELTAGIAHEIQNPLNFVNNFSEVSGELLEEMVEELDDGNLDETREIIRILQHNLEKIHHHGGRADSIVKGMLQHSRAGSGEKAPTDLNKLADEYVRLAYHGLRAKDASFNAQFETALDPALPMVRLVPEDIGRVLLNLINNAFQAVAEKKSSREDGTFKPLVTISTKKVDDMIEIQVSDNGPGIPDEIRDKIFQPFFTTKPTGQGTGLGLSLSYDIVKAHGGKLTVESKSGEGSIFRIILPLKTK